MRGTAIKFSIYTIESPHLKIAGIARYPLALWDAVRRDADLETPWTPLGRRIKSYDERDDLTFSIRSRDMSYDISRAALEEMISDEAYEHAGAYSLVDDGDTTDTEGGDERLVADYVPVARGKPFASPEASAELQWTLLRHFATYTGHPGHGDVVDFLAIAFRDACVSRPTPAAYCMVYNAKKKRVVLKQGRDTFEETTLSDFADRVIPWFMDAMLNVLKIAIHREVATSSSRAFEMVRALRRVVCVDQGTLVTLFDVIAGRGPMQKLQRLKLTGEHMAFRKFVMHMLQDSADTDIVITYEKLKNMYPPNHPDAPDSRKHLKKCRDMRMRRDIEALGPTTGEWFKDFLNKGVNT